MASKIALKKMQKYGRKEGQNPVVLILSHFLMDKENQISKCLHFQANLPKVLEKKI